MAQQQNVRQGATGDDAIAHATTSSAKGAKPVTDPVTKNTVEIADAGQDFIRNARDPHLSVPNSNLGKPTVNSVFNNVLVCRLIILTLACTNPRITAES